MSSILKRPRSAEISGPIHSMSGGASSGPARLIQTQPPHSSAATGGRADAVEVLGVEVLALGHADERARRVVDPAVVRTGEPAGAAALQLADDRRATVLAHVVERGERAVGLAGDRRPSRRGPRTSIQSPAFATCGRPAGEDPVLAEDALTLELEADRVGVRVAAHRARAVVGDLADRGPSRTGTSPRVGT